MNQGNEIWAWQELSSGRDGWGIIATMVPGLTGPTPLIARSEEVMKRAQPLAEAHAKTSNHR